MKTKALTKAFTLVELLAAVAITAVILVIFIPTGIWISPKAADRALVTQGYSDVQITDRAYYFLGFRGGSASDSVRFTCKAKNPAGKVVTVYVFTGWWKYSTIRTP